MAALVPLWPCQQLAWWQLADGSERVVGNLAFNRFNILSCHVRLLVRKKCHVRYVSSIYCVFFEHFGTYLRYSSIGCFSGFPGMHVLSVAPMAWLIAPTFCMATRAQIRESRGKKVSGTSGLRKRWVLQSWGMGGPQFGPQKWLLGFLPCSKFGPSSRCSETMFPLSTRQERH